MAEAKKDERVRVVITCGEIYLPLDEDGNVPLEITDEMHRNTVPVKRRTRLFVPKAMADWFMANDKGEAL